MDNSINNLVETFSRFCDIYYPCMAKTTDWNFKDFEEVQEEIIKLRELLSIELPNLINEVTDEEFYIAMKIHF